MEILKKETCIECKFDSEEERNIYVESMIKGGWGDCGQVRKDINQSFSDPKWVWYCSLYKLD